MVRNRMLTPALASRSGVRRHDWHPMLRTFRTGSVVERRSFSLHAKHLTDVPAGSAPGGAGTRTWLYLSGRASSDRGRVLISAGPAQAARYGLPSYTPIFRSCGGGARKRHHQALCLIVHTPFCIRHHISRIVYPEIKKCITNPSAVAPGGAVH